MKIKYYFVIFQLFFATRILFGQSADLFSIDGSGNTGIYVSSPTARLQIGQNGQEVGKGLRFDDGINDVWDITHGFGLRFHFGGNLRGFINANTGAYVQSSDRRLKSGIRSMDGVLSKIKKIEPMQYRYINSEGSMRSYGFIAQEVLPYFPELVHYSRADGIYGISYGEVAVVAIKAIKELNELVESQEKQIESLRKEIESLK